ncbi:C/H/G cyclin [Wallemia mellicola CBS 633.66]|uniref:C/H/G cyclin n=1 Tax=Wallemia mellicola (strain ATCC MYA-4683 / CBS 633.66) TaxID=671144 RepID=I4Y8N2_WALMC|nr:C/H/G cyclin [Wallemia mellicola CBS 633.66]EIM20324.1 C/H/G cyclin [Wallemia mellicola CBS 633.66]|eukprot:XP_006959581.1 C/H/G cyclin [Wallemia mellicola CBS 633.66]
MTFWNSSQIKECRSLEEYNKIKKLDKSKLKDDYYKLEVYSINILNKFGKKVTNRQRVLSTASVYLKRFYLFNNYLETDLYLIIITCLYLSSKVEELPLSIKYITNEFNKQFKTTYKIQDISKMEFNLINDLDYNLVVYHPDFRQFHLEDKINNLCYYILNDIYKTNLLLLFQPYTISIAIIVFAYSIQNNTEQSSQLLSQLNADLDIIQYIIQEILKLYKLLPTIVDNDIYDLYLNSHF